MAYSVFFTPEAEDQLIDLYRYIAEQASPEIAELFTRGVVEFCEGLTNFPERAVRRDDIRPGIFVTNYRGRVVIADTVEADVVSIIGTFYGGRDFESLLRLDDER